MKFSRQNQSFSFRVVTTMMLLLVSLIATTTISAFTGPLVVARNKVVLQKQQRQQRQLFSSASATIGQTISITDGIVKSITVPGRTGEKVRLGDIATVRYSCYLASSESSNNNDNIPPFAKSPANVGYQKFAVGDGSMIDGWDLALRSMNIGERCLVRITDPLKYGYGSMGVPPLIPPNAILEMDIQILDSVSATMNIDFDSLAMKADNTPRTAQEISNAYQVRQQIKANDNTPELEGIEYWIAKIKSYYFYGLFEGETGEKAPWFLRPSITFPLAFFIVGAAFYVSLLGGAISERGEQSTDELDEIILLSTTSSLPSYSYSTSLLSTTALMEGVISETTIV